ncbi:hypothetical protein EAI_09229, partial [Harpegnathos saltator]
LTASVINVANTVLGIAIKSGNIKGTFVKAFRDAAAAISVGAKLLNKRVMDGGGEKAEILEEMRNENLRLRTSYKEVKKKVGELRE